MADGSGAAVCRSITQSYYRNSVGVVLVFDICQRASFEHVPTWMMEARRSIEPRTPTFVLVGSKADQEKRREVRPTPWAWALLLMQPARSGYIATY